MNESLRGHIIISLFILFTMFACHVVFKHDDDTWMSAFFHFVFGSLSEVERGREGQSFVQEMTQGLVERRE